MLGIELAGVVSRLIPQLESLDMDTFENDERVIEECFQTKTQLRDLTIGKLTDAALTRLGAFAAGLSKLSCYCHKRDLGIQISSGFSEPFNDVCKQSLLYWSRDRGDRSGIASADDHSPELWNVSG